MYQILLVDTKAPKKESDSGFVEWERYGYALAGRCSNGEEVLAFLSKNHVDVVITDICMPGMDGMQLSEKLCADYPDIKIIILSEYDDFGYARKAIRYGVKEYLLKPVDMKELGEALTALKKELDAQQEARQKKLELEEAYRKGRRFLYFDALMHLLRGSKANEEIQKELQTVGMDLHSAIYRVGVVELDIYSRENKLDEERKRESALMAFVLYNISQEIVQKKGAGEVCQGYDYRTYMLLHSSRQTEFKQTVKDICKEIIDKINEIMHLAVNIGLGSYETQTETLCRSYEGAEEALAYRYTMGGNHVLEIEEIRKEKRQADTDGLLGQIVLHVKENNAQAIAHDFAAMVGMLQECRYDRRSAGVVLQRAADMLDGLCRLAGAGHDEITAAKEETLKEALSAGELEAAADILRGYCVKVGESFANGKDTSGRKYAVLAMDYMERNYGDCNLSLHSVCSWLNISASRFSTIFKQATGATFMEALIGIRMQKAKELLGHTNMKNYEIAERVGFNDSHYFGVVFKKATGKTPSAYAKELRAPQMP